MYLLYDNLYFISPHFFLRPHKLSNIKNSFTQRNNYIFINHIIYFIHPLLCLSKKYLE